jgi:sphingomyelin phosphodiesterase
MMFLLICQLALASAASQSCLSCQFAATSVQVWATSTKTKSQLAALTNYICAQSWAPESCSLSLPALMPELVQALQLRYFAPSRFCAVIGACASPVYTLENFTAWENSVMQGAADYFEPTIGESYFNFAQLTDVHLDLNYIVGAATSCSQPPCCRDSPLSSGGASAYGDYNCDLPLSTLQEATNELAKQNLDFIIWTGDSPAHDPELTQAQRSGSLSAVTQLLWSEFGTVVPVYPIFGNSECYPDSQFNFSSSNPLPAQAASLWAQWIGTSAAASLKANGFYSVMHRNTNLKIVAINTLACDYENFWLLANVSDPGGNIAFLQSELEQAEANNQYVYIIGHVPPASEQCLSLWAMHYQVLIRRYANIVRGQFFGHQHTDEFRITRDKENNPIGVQFLAPALDTYGYINPSFRIYRADFLSKSVLSFAQYRMNLNSAAPAFGLAYDFADYYLVKNMFPSTLQSLAAQMKGNELVAMKYISNKFTYSPKVPNGCNQQCLSDNWCDVSYDRPDTIRECKGLKPAPIQALLTQMYGPWIVKH